MDGSDHRNPAAERPSDRVHIRPAPDFIADDRVGGKAPDRRKDAVPFFAAADYIAGTKRI